MTDAKPIEIIINQEQLKRLEQKLKSVPQELPKVLARAINKTAAAARTSISRDISFRSTLKHKDLQKSVRLRKATYKTLLASINFSGKRLPLIQFNARQTGKGVTYMIDSAQGRKLIESAFIAKVASAAQKTQGVSHRGVYVRKGAKRLPISEKFGPSLGVMLNGLQGFFEKANSIVGADLEKNIDIQVNLILKKLRDSK